MSKNSSKLNKKQVLSIPKRLKTKNVREVAEDLGVSWNAVWYWVCKLREKGMKVDTRKKGRIGLLS